MSAQSVGKNAMATSLGIGSPSLRLCDLHVQLWSELPDVLVVEMQFKARLVFALDFHMGRAVRYFPNRSALLLINSGRPCKDTFKSQREMRWFWFLPGASYFPLGLNTTSWIVDHVQLEFAREIPARRSCSSLLRAGTDE